MPSERDKTSENPHESPMSDNVELRAQNDEVSLASRVAKERYAIAIIVGFVVCWVSFLEGLELTLKEPPHWKAYVFFAIACLAGLTVEIVGLLYIVRNTNIFITPVRPYLALLVFVMLITMLPVSVAALSLLHDLNR